jgi:aryl-alcohol dehydrogenase-like predicted oxidoreductase
VHPVTAVQSEYSIWERNLEGDIIPVLRELDIGLVPFSPLGRGFLAGEVKRAEDYAEGDSRKRHPRFQGANFDANVEAARIVRGFAEARSVTPAQIAIAWILHKDPNCVPIPGTKRRKYLEENIAAAALQLTPAEMKALDEAVPPGTGERYSAAMMAQIDR